MTRIDRIRSETVVAWKSFLRRRTAVFFTFGFPLILVAIFGVAIQTGPTGSGLFGRPTGYYVAGYLAVIVLFTPISRVGNTVARDRDRRRFEKLATTPLRRSEWLFAHVLVNTVVILLAGALILVVLLALTDAAFTFSPVLLIFLVAGVVVFAGVGAVIGRLSDSRDGVVAASNGVALPLVFLSDTFVHPSTFPEWVRVGVELSPLTYFARGVRSISYTGEPATFELAVLCGLAVASFVLGVLAIPTRE
jgi:ABC-2 type transport system permease protein